MWSALGIDIDTVMTQKTSKLVAILCVTIVFALGVSCQLHAEPHTHGSSHASHDDDYDDETTSSIIDDLTCIAAVIPSIGRLLVLSALKHDISFSSAKPLVPVFELYIPPRFSV